MVYVWMVPSLLQEVRYCRIVDTSHTKKNRTVKSILFKPLFSVAPSVKSEATYLLTMDDIGGLKRLVVFL